MEYEDDSYMGIPEGIEEEPTGFLESLLDKGNIVDKLENNAEATQKMLELYEAAERSMADWLKKYKRAINLAKLQAMSGDTEINEKSFPFEGASLAMLPFVTEAMIDFNSRAAPELVWSENIVRVKVYGNDSPQIEQPQMPMAQPGMPQQGAPMQQEEQIKKTKEDRADRVSKYMNYQLAEVIPNWRDEQDKNLMVLPCVGTSYKITRYDYDKKEVCSTLYLGNQIKFNMGFNNFCDAPDKFIDRKYTLNEVIGFIRGEQKWQLSEDDLDKDKTEFEFIEGYTWFDIDGDGLKEPYCAIVDVDSSKIVALYPDFDEDTINRSGDEIVSVESLDCITQYRFLPDPEGGPMGMGWGILLGPMFESINANLRQLIDAGTFQNAAGSSGFITTDLAGGLGNTTQAGTLELALGKLTPISVRNGSIRDSIFQPPAAGPSTVLFQLLEYLVEAARGMSNASINVEAVQGEAAALYLARLQQGLKVPNSITMRVYSAATREKQKIGLLNYKHYDDNKYNRVLDGKIEYSMKADFNPEDCDIRMAADPAQGSDIERVQRADTVLQEAKVQPQQVLNLRAAYVDWLKAMGHPNIDEIAPEPDPNAVDPNQQLMIAQLQMEAELKQKDQQLRERTLQLQERKIAMQAAKEMGELGMDAEKQIAETTKLYTDALKNIVDSGISASSAMGVIQTIEDTFIGEGAVNNARQISESDLDSSRIMAPRSGDQSSGTGIRGVNQ